LEGVEIDPALLRDIAVNLTADIIVLVVSWATARLRAKWRRRPERRLTNEWIATLDSYGTAAPQKVLGKARDGRTSTGKRPEQ
jgi:hypothetical protein